MSFVDTSLGGTKKDFPKTAWDLVQQARDPSDDVRRAGLEELCRRYWKPVYYYVRISCAKSNEEAKDLAQGFFMHLVESDDLKQYKPERASFRTYLKMVLKRFVQDEDKKIHALKRGGGSRIVGLEALETVGSTPDDAFDHGWRVALLREAVDRVRDRFLTDGRSTKFLVFEAYDLCAETERPTYAALAERFAVKASDVQNYLVLVRREILVELRAHLDKSTANPEELRDEWHALFAS
jgi:RNA polymerase sigma factor (sigma-70 family)